MTNKSIMPRIETWFPKMVYLIDDVCVNKLNEYEKEIKKSKNKTKRTSAFNVNSSHLEDRKLNKNKVFQNLCEEIETHSRLFLSYMGYGENYIAKCSINDMWFNISNKDDFLFPHTHPGSILAGAFYVKASKNNVITFHDDNNNTYEPPKNITNLSMTKCDYNCVPGRLILFRSNFIHSTPKQEFEGEKIVISFNINKL